MASRRWQTWAGVALWLVAILAVVLAFRLLSAVPGGGRISIVRVGETFSVGGRTFVVEEIQIVAVPCRIGSEVNGRAARQVAVRCPGLGEERENRLLQFGQRHNDLPTRQASRLPFFISVSATQSTSSSPISRSGR